MTAHDLPSVTGGTLQLDLCYPCRGIWIDPRENILLAPTAVVALFRLLHEHRDDPHQPLAEKAHCPRCADVLKAGFDVVRSGRYLTYRCPAHHGRFSAFSSFMIEKGFVRQLTRAEIDDMAQRTAVIHCSCCGAPVDLRQDSACPYCHAALSLLDPQAVERALQGYAAAAREQSTVKLPQLADALVMIERDRQRALRDEQARRGVVFSGDAAQGVDLWAAGISMVWNLLN